MQLTDDAPIGRDQLMESLFERSCTATRRGVMLTHTEPAYAGHVGNVRLPNSKRASIRSILIPLYPGMTDDEQDQVIAAVLRLEPTLAKR